MASVEGNLLSAQLQSWKKSSEFPQDLVPTNTGVFLWKPRGLRAGWNLGFYTSFWPLWLPSVTQIFILHAKAVSNAMLYISALISVEEGEQFN